MRPVRRSQWLAAVLAATVLTACERPPEPEPDSGRLVRTAEVRMDRLQHRLSFFGVLEPVMRARLAFQTPGVLATRPAQLGQAVRKGELLATLDNPELGPAQKAAAARLQETLAQRDQAARDLARLRSLVRTGAVGEEQVEQKAAELDSLEAAVARTEADLAGSRQRLEDAALLAPFDGVVSMIAVEPGEFVSAGQAVMAVGGLDLLEVRVLLPATLVSSLRHGDVLAVRVPQLGDGELRGRITERSEIGERDTGLFPIIVELAPGREFPMVRPGMQAEVLVNYADLEALIAPLSAVVDPVGGDPHIFIAAGGKVRKQPVRVLAVANQEVALAADEGALAAGDLVVIAGHRALSDGQPVRLTQ